MSDPKQNDAAKAAEAEALRKAAEEKAKADKAEAQKAEDAAKAAEAAKENALHADIKKALRKLDHDKDNDWMEDGKPSLKRIVQIVGNNKVTREDVEAADPGFRREKPKPLVATGSRRNAEKSKDAGKEVENVRVKAIRPGQYAGRIYKPGETFVYSGVVRSWFEVTSDKEKSKD